MFISSTKLGSFLITFIFLSFLLSPVFGFAAVFNVNNSAELQDALSTAASNGEDDTINIAAGTFNTNGSAFSYMPAAFENFALTLVGDGSGSTILDGVGLDLVIIIDTTFVTDDSNSNITIRDLSIRNGNNSDGDGGGLFVITEFANITIENCEFSSNVTVLDGSGAQVFSDSGNIILTNNTFINNIAGNSGGGVEVTSISGDISITNNTFDNNSSIANIGGADVDSDSGIITVTNNTFINNSAGGLAGAFQSDTGSEGITLSDNFFMDNSATINAGAVDIKADSVSIILTNNIFIRNSAVDNGGGATLLGREITLTNNTFTLNSTNADGGAVSIDVTEVETVNIFNNIAFNNTAVGDGDDIFVNDDLNNDLFGSTVNLFNNDFSDFFSVCENTIGCIPDINQGNNLDADPLFVDAQAGNVNLTAISPVIDAGDPNAPDLPSKDFAGNPRIIGSAPDMGALEFIGGGGNGCSLANGPLQIGNANANVMTTLLLLGLTIGLRALRRNSKRVEIRKT